MKTIVTTLLLVFLINPYAYSEEKDDASSLVSITPIEHASAVLQWKQLTIYIDPVGGKNAFMDQSKPNLILVTDIHGDHLSVETLNVLDTKDTTIVAPQAVADKLPEKLRLQTVVLNNGDYKSVHGINIEAVAMYNLRKEALHFHPKGRGNGYLITLGGERIYFSGDTEDISEMRSLKNVDKAFVCMNLPYTMTVASAAAAVLEFKPKEVYPYHYRGKPEVSDVDKFKKLIEAENSNIKVVQLDWYPNADY